MYVAFVNTEAQLYDDVNMTGFVYNVSPIEITEKNEQQFSLRKDYIDKISLSLETLRRKLKNKPRSP